MDQQEQLELQQQIEEYLQQHHIYQLLQGLLQEVILRKPDNVLDFLIKQLEGNQNSTLKVIAEKLILVIYPPGLAISEPVRNYFVGCEVVHCGKILLKSSEGFGEQAKEHLKQCRLVTDSRVDALMLQHIKKPVSADKSCIVLGYPRSLAQAIHLQRNSIIPTTVLFVNIDQSQLRQLCSTKLDKPHHSVNRGEQVEAMVTEYRINNKALKRFYSTYREIDISKDKSPHAIEQLFKETFEHKLQRLVPRTNTQIIVIGAPVSGRTTLGRRIAQQCNLVYISTARMILEEIRRDTIHGQKMKEPFMKKAMIDSFLIDKLIEERIQKKDCKMQGFVLEGYPKDQAQFENLKSMRINPTLIVALDCPIEVSAKRLPQSDANFSDRFQKWNSFSQFLHSSNEPILFVKQDKKPQHAFESVMFQLDKVWN